MKQRVQTHQRLRNMVLRCVLMLSLFIFLITPAGATSQAPKHSKPGIAPEVVADYLFSIISAHRTTYTGKVVARMQAQGVVLASEDWERRKALPLPAQFLMEAAHLMEEKQKGVRFRLIGLWPTYQRNSPATNFERQGLQTLKQDPDKAVTGIVTSGKKQYFQAIYADRAVSEACVVCHNTHPRSPKHDFKLGDVMGGVVITIPLNP